ncbi:unnamed protein product [Sphenostylis stenocarpa]|uniref:Uncharacterized protein n=1 Tax=Sphenostylis stenocarpa TaxID=92480 RepID=A0AA86VZI5_9FABA|nr:unnamed protein product [Sphenostylis stenocarpa]
MDSPASSLLSPSLTDISFTDRTGPHSRGHLDLSVSDFTLPHPQPLPPSLCPKAISLIIQSFPSADAAPLDEPP